MIVGMAPGKEEAREGIAFVGPSGEVLKRAVIEAGWSLSRTLMTNTVHCRPFDEEGNVDPQPYEIAQCQQWLTVEVGIADPSVVLLLGKTAIPIAFPGYKPSEASCKVRSLPWLGRSRVFVGGYHPAATLHNKALKRDFEQAVRTAVDLVKVVEGARRYYAAYKSSAEGTEPEKDGTEA